MSENDGHENYMPAEFAPMLNKFLMGTDQMVDVVLGVAAVREPEKYRDMKDLVKAGRVIPQTVVRGGLLEISLIDAETGANIGEVFRFVSPALDARGPKQ